MADDTRQSMSGQSMVRTSAAHACAVSRGTAAGDAAARPVAMTFYKTMETTVKDIQHEDYLYSRAQQGKTVLPPPSLCAQ